MDKQLIKLDKKDRQIIYQLDINSRQSLSKIAKKVGLSQQVVSYRLNKLVKTQVIRCLTFIDFSKLGFFIHNVNFRFRNINEKKFNQIIDYIKKNERVRVVVGADGVYDLIVSVLAKDILEFEWLVEGWMDMFEKFISEKVIGTIVWYEYLGRDYLLNKKKRDFIFSKKMYLKKSLQKVSLDQKNIRILKLLSTNSRISSVEIAKKLNISADAISFRIKKLEKSGVIKKYGVHINDEKIGQLRYIILLGLNHVTKERTKEFFQFCKSQPNIIYINKIFGEWNTEINLEVENHPQYRKVISELKNNFSDIIKWYMPLIIYKFYKYDCFPMEINDLFLHQLHAQLDNL